MSDLNKIFDLKNMRRAYRWILSNTDAKYKSYFRDSYAAFAVSSESLIRDLRQRCISNRYTPSHASKIMAPKPSGTLRPITLLTTEDQIVYQACVNIIADCLKQKTKQRYHKRVFAHLYAGKTSQFFYFKWQNSYRKMAQQTRKNFSDGYTYVATFDLTAFYDSIDHHVLQHFLHELYLNEDAIRFLMECLRKWTSSTWNTSPTAIYHEHGIPQGPLSSGMLSEAVLQHLDIAGERGRKTRYLRYVDDIRIFAKSEAELRRKLIGLDLASKEIDLFPQTSKINIRIMTNPNDEIKSVSRPLEPSVFPTIDQTKLKKRILAITRRSSIPMRLSTRFKYLLAFVEPTYTLSIRLLDVLYHHPEYSGEIGRYFSRYKTISPRIAHNIVLFISNFELYQSVNADLLRACLGRLPAPEASAMGRFAARRLLRPPRGSIRVQASYKEALVAWALTTREINYTEFETLLSNETDWWVRKCMLRELSKEYFGLTSYRALLNKSLRIQESETARAAAAKLIADLVPLTGC